MIIGVGALVRLPDLTAPLWYDEVFSARVTALPLPRLLNATAGDVHPPGYYLFLKGWCLLFSNSELALRVPSMLAGIALIYLVYRLASALSLTHPACVGASVITALAPFQVYYSQEARPYAVVMAALVLAALGLVERRWWWFIIGILGALYCNTMALFVVIGLGLAGLWLARNDRHYWFSIGTIGLGYLPALLMVLTQAGNVSNGYWILPPFSPGKLISVIDDLLFFSPKTPFVFASATLTAFAVYLILSRFSLPAVLDSPALYSLYSAGVIPICLAAIVSMLWTPVLLSRAMAGAAPFLYLLISWAATQDKLTARMWFAGAGLVMASVLLGGIFTNHMGRVDWLAGNDTIQPGDAVYHTSLGSYLPYQYYWPNNPHYLMPQTHSIANDLTPQTKKALSIDSAEIPLDNVICQTPARRWVLGLTLSALNTPADAQTITALQTQYAPYRVKHAQTVFSDGGLYVVNCPSDLKKLLNNVPPGAKITIETPDGETIVETTPTKDDLIDKSLIGQPITVTEAAEKYDVGNRTIQKWVKQDYITVITPGYRMELNEADVAYCAEIYHERKTNKIGFRAPLLDEAGLPYQLKHPKLAKYRLKKRKQAA